MEIVKYAEKDVEAIQISKKFVKENNIVFPYIDTSYSDPILWLNINTYIGPGIIEDDNDDVLKFEVASKKEIRLYKKYERLNRI